MTEFNNLEQADEIKLLQWPECVKARPGMYIGGTDATCTSTLLREIIDNATDECQHTANKVVIDRNFNGLNLVADNGRGISIEYNKSVPGVISADLSISSLHSGSKFLNNKSATVGQNGVGSAVTNALSSDYILMSRITPLNYDKSLPEVKKLWDSCGPRSKKELFYIVWYKQGVKHYEGAHKKADIEKQLFGNLKTYKEIPSDMSTIVMFNPDPTVFTESVNMDIPIDNLRYFLLIQEKFYNKKVSLWVDGQELKDSGFVGFRSEFIKRIIPSDTSMNEYIDLFVSFEADPGLANKDEFGSVNGLVVNSGVHLSYVEDYFAKALKDAFDIKHKYLTNGLKLCVIALASEAVFSSQTKEKLKSFSKVKEIDFEPIVKEFQKIFRKDSDYWMEHVAKLNYYAESMKSLSAVDKAQKMIDNATGSSIYKSRSGLVKGFADATYKDRWECELFLCFTGDTEILTCNDERIKFTDLVPRIKSGENIYTFSCRSDGEIIPAKIIRAQQIKTTDKLCKITLDNGEEIKCTPDHRMLMRDGTYKEAKDLINGDSLMPCYITYSDNYDNDKRRVVLDMKPSSNKNYRPDEFSKNNNGTLVPVFHVMSEHKDTIIDESSIGLDDNINRHHIDKDKLNDYPTNIMLCSKEKHMSFHSSENSNKLHKLAHENEDLYNKIYVDNKNTEQFKKKQSDNLKNFYKSQKGKETKKLLREFANKEWSNKSLKIWRSKETIKYCKEHPEFAKQNSILAKLSYWNNKLLPEIEKIINNNNWNKTSKNFNKAVLILRSTSDFKRIPDFNKIESYIIHGKNLLSDYIKVDNDSISYIKSEEILEELKNNNKQVTLENYNDLVRLKYNTKSVTKGRGYLSNKSKFPELFKKYEALCNTNHKVISVELFDVKDEPVYCLEVDTPEHNFPLAAGVFTKNCEGDSAAGGLIESRRPWNGQGIKEAVLPLRGKILNVSDVDIDHALENKEISTIFTILGVGIQEKNVTSECKTEEEAYEVLKKYARYGKIVICTDADSDGSQIASLILYLFSKYARFLIDLGCLYILVSPLFEQDGHHYYPGDPIDEVTGLPIGLNPNKPFRRWKGLGSIKKELRYNVFFNPGTRKLVRVTPEGIDYAMSLTEDIDVRKKLLFDSGVISNPYNFTDI